jgi:hypothetical protein
VARPIIDFVHPDDIAATSDALARAIDTGVVRRYRRE